MNSTMRELQELARKHMADDVTAGGTWRCTCGACREMRALVGMDKLLEVWPLVRAITQIEEELEQLPDGAAKDARRAQFNELYDRLAVAMAHA
jgi:hypothetical protein